MKEKMAVFLDIDGTLIGDTYKISDRNKKAILDAKSKGHFIFINTGRSLGNIPEELKKEISICDGIVSGNGTYININGNIIHEQYFDRELLISVTKQLINKGDYWAVFEGRDRIIGLNDVPEVWHTKFHITETENFETVYKDEAIQVIAIGPTVPEDIKAEYKNDMLFIQMHGFADCVHPLCSKADGMKKVLGIINIPTERCIAVGDSENDLTMLRAAGISVAVANAAPPVLNTVIEVTDSNINDGVAKTIEKYCL